MARHVRVSKRSRRGCHNLPTRKPSAPEETIGTTGNPPSPLPNSRSRTWWWTRLSPATARTLHAAPVHSVTAAAIMTAWRRDRPASSTRMSAGEIRRKSAIGSKIPEIDHSVPRTRNCHHQASVKSGFVSWLTRCLIVTMTTLEANITARSCFARRTTRSRTRAWSTVCRHNVATMNPHSIVSPVDAHPRGSPQRPSALVAGIPASVMAWVDAMRTRKRPRAMSM